MIVMGNWNEMDFDDRCEAVWKGTHRGELVKQIALDHGAKPRDVIDFARSAGITYRDRLPGSYTEKRRGRLVKRRLTAPVETRSP